VPLDCKRAAPRARNKGTQGPGSSAMAIGRGGGVRIHRHVRLDRQGQSALITVTAMGLKSLHRAGPGPDPGHV